MKTKQEINKELVIEAFDTLFNKRDYGDAEEFWSPQYIQQSAHIGPGRQGLFDLIKSTPAIRFPISASTSILSGVSLPDPLRSVDFGQRSSGWPVGPYIHPCSTTRLKLVR
jgi:hypothetical protein